MADRFLDGIGVETVHKPNEAVVEYVITAESLITNLYEVVSALSTA